MRYTAILKNHGTGWHLKKIEQIKRQNTTVDFPGLTILFDRTVRPIIRIRRIIRYFRLSDFFQKGVQNLIDFRLILLHVFVINLAVPFAGSLLPPDEAILSFPSR